MYILMINMETVMTIRIPRDMQAKMKKYSRNWSEELRAYIASRLKALELVDLLVKLKKQTKSRRVTSDSTILIREDRDSR